MDCIICSTSTTIDHSKHFTTTRQIPNDNCIYWRRYNQQGCWWKSNFCVDAYVNMNSLFLFWSYSFYSGFLQVSASYAFKLRLFKDHCNVILLPISHSYCCKSKRTVCISVDCLNAGFVCRCYNVSNTISFLPKHV